MGNPSSARAIIVVASVALAWTLAACGAAPSPTNTPTLTPPPTWTLQPTYTPYPTYTPLPVPTDKPQSTASSASVLSPEEQAYVLKVEQLANAYSEAFAEIGRLATKASRDRALLADDHWQFMMGVPLTRLTENGKKVRALTPPPKMETTHDYFMKASRHFDSAAQIVTDAIDYMDPGRFGWAASELDLGEEDIVRVIAEINTLSGH